MQNKQDKKKKPIKVRDLKASKDAKGGVRTDVSVSGHDVNRRVTLPAVQRPGNQD